MDHDPYPGGHLHIFRVVVNCLNQYFLLESLCLRGVCHSI